MDLTYRTEGGSQIPNLTLPAEAAVPLGKYGRLRKRHLQQHNPILYTSLLTTCTLNQHLAEIDLIPDADALTNEQVKTLLQKALTTPNSTVQSAALSGAGGGTGGRG